MRTENFTLVGDTFSICGKTYFNPSIILVSSGSGSAVKDLTGVSGGGGSFGLFFDDLFDVVGVTGYLGFGSLGEVFVSGGTTGAGEGAG